MASSGLPKRNPHQRVSRRLGRLPLLLLGAGLVFATPAGAQERFVKIGNLTDYDFGLIANFSADRSLARDICVYSAKSTPGYNVRAIGGGAGGAFTLAGAGSTLNYAVQWSPQPGRSTGTTLLPNVLVTGFVTNATQANCSSGPLASASLIVLIRANSLQAAFSGSYSGVLTVIVGAE
jgi:hypothetical protein